MPSRVLLIAKFLLSLALLAACGIRAQDTTLAGWTFSQFLGEGAPSINAQDFSTTNFIVATYRGAADPVSAQVDGTVVAQNGSAGYADARFGAWSFGGFNIDNAVDVRADTFNALNTINSRTLDRKDMHLTDSAGMMLTFNRTATLWDIQVNGTDGYANAATSDFTFAARGNGGAATVEWLFNDAVFATTTIVAGSFAIYDAELPVAFYGNGLIRGRLVSGSVSFDNVQFNGQLGTPPQFTLQPEPLVRIVGESATFSVAVSGAADPTFQWFKGATPIPGATTSTYAISSVSLGDDSIYRVAVRSSNGLAADSNAVRLEVRQAPLITRPPAAQFANPGQSVTFSVLASGTPAPVYRWQRGGVDLAEGGSISGVTGPELTIANVAQSDEGDYRVVVTNAVGSVASATAALTVTSLSVAPSVATAPADAVGVEGGRVEFFVVASGAPAPTYRWRFDGRDLVDGSGVSGAATDRLILENLTTARAGTYSVVVENSAGSLEREARLVVQVPPAAVSGPGPSSRFVAAGSDVTFSVDASGDPAPAFQWLRDGEPIAGQTSATLTLRGVTIADQAVYSVRLTNDVRSVVSAGSELRVGSAARIISSPRSAVGTLGGTITFTVLAEGTPAPAYQWFHDGKPLADATESSLTLSNLSSADAGAYFVRVTNEFATVTSDTAQLRVALPVAVSRPGQTQTFTPGSTLVIGAAGTPGNMLRYEWFRDGRRIAGAGAAQLTISDAAFTDGGVYSVKIYNTAGRLVSSRVIARIAVSVANGYDVLLRGSSDDAPAGIVRIDVARTGSFTGRLHLVDGSVHTFRGSLAFASPSSAGVASVDIRRKGASTLTLAFDLDAKLAELGCALGEGGSVRAAGSSDRRLSGSAPWAGSYSLALGSAGATPIMLNATISPAGVLAISGRLADGSRVSFSGPASSSGSYAVLLLPYRKGAGHLAGELQMESSSAGYFADAESSGVWRWRRIVSGSFVESSITPMLSP